MANPPGFIVAATASGSGKTMLAAGMLRHFRRRGVAVAPFKTGPDYIDAAFLAAAAGRDCVNLDCWAMRRETIADLALGLGGDGELVIGEGVMGLFDGASDQTGSTADLATLTGWPVVLVVDVRGQGASAAAVLRGFAGHRDDVPVAGVLFNRVGGASHAEMLRQACTTLDVPVLGCIPRDDELATSERHLGLVQAGEHRNLECLLDHAADAIAKHVDLAALQGLARPARLTIDYSATPPVPPLGQRIAVARDTAFAFCYPWLLDRWRRAGAEVSFFSPLADEAPERNADAVYLPGGYPELHGGRLAANEAFMVGVRDAAWRGAPVYGECGGFMVLGRTLTDGQGVGHAMAGLLPHATSFTEPRLHLGYRRLTLATGGPLGLAGAAFRGHEFHYASITGNDAATPLFQGADPRERPLDAMGAVAGSVFGSFAHLVDQAP
ncbi:MAG: cobyrinate a,c-diamide synthase [Pseudomonadota bacterium]|nr:cobyrinate a,c-diamide synthase [Pseudomonadota bacterium]